MNEIQKMYKRGFYGGKFLPLHKGHKYCIEYGAVQCEELVVILFYGSDDEEECLKSPDIRCDGKILLAEDRIKKVNQWCKNLENVRFVALDDAFIKSEGEKAGLGVWDAEAAYVRASVGEFQVVYSSEQAYDDYFKMTYPFAVHCLIDVERRHVPISATQIRKMTDLDGRKWL